MAGEARCAGDLQNRAFLGDPRCGSLHGFLAGLVAADDFTREARGHSDHVPIERRCGAL